MLWWGAVIAQEDPAPPSSANEPTEITPITATNPSEADITPSAEELKEIEWIKSQLGSSYSIATRLERLTVANDASSEQDLPRIVGPHEMEVESSPRLSPPSGETTMLRRMARQLEQSAADLEERGDFDLADEMRQLALSHWRLARVTVSSPSGNSGEAER